MTAAVNVNHHTSIATRKDHRCDECGRRIPIGARYWVSENGGFRQYTNCLEYTKEPLLDMGYNQLRPKRKGEG